MASSPTSPGRVLNLFEYVKGPVSSPLYQFRILAGNVPKSGASFERFGIDVLKTKDFVARLLTYGGWNTWRPKQPYFGRGAEPGRFLSTEVSQSSGGKLILQKRGEGSLNSTPTGILPSSGLPKETALLGNSSAVFGLISQMTSSRTSCALSSTRHP